MQRTSITYLTHTWNPLAMRCTPVSEACLNCWHIRMAKRHAANPHFTEDERAAYAGHNIVLREKELEAPLKLRKPARIGTQFMGDLFRNDVSYHWIERIWDVMEQTPQHTYMVLTKRADYMLTTMEQLQVSHGILPNIWLGVTVENQKRADERIPLLLQCPAAVRFVSVEPMLGPIELPDSGVLGMHHMLTTGHQVAFGGGRNGRRAECVTCRRIWNGIALDWIIVGAESGPGARPMHPDWARDVRAQCKAAGVPFFFKQMSNKAPIPDDLMVREWSE